MACPWKVIAWLNKVDSAELYLTMVSIAEISYGLQTLPKGSHRDELSERLLAFVDRGFTSRI